MPPFKMEKAKQQTLKKRFYLLTRVENFEQETSTRCD